MQFFDKYVRPSPKLHDYSKEKSKTEVAGYLSADRRIAALMQAGGRLREARAELFDSEDGSEDVDLDPTRSKGFDLADAFQITNSIMNSKKTMVPVEEPKEVVEHDGSEEKPVQ